MSLHVLVVEDEAIVRKDLTLTLSRLGFQVTGEVSSAEEAVALMGTVHIDLILLDIKLRGETDGYQLAQRVNALSPSCGIIIMSAYSPSRHEHVPPNVIGYLAKPFDAATLASTLESAKEALKALQ